MHIHRFEKLWLGASVVLILAFIATVTYGAVGVGVTMVDDSGGTTDSDLISDGEFGAAQNFRAPGVYQSGPDEYDVYVVARQFAFEPGSRAPIEIPAGSTVTFHVTSADVIHGFELVGTNVNTMVIPGQVATITVAFDEPGEYGLVCHEYCGAAHHTMAGQVHVVPAPEFNATDTEGET